MLLFRQHCTTVNWYLHHRVPYHIYLRTCFVFSLLLISCEVSTCSVRVSVLRRSKFFVAMPESISSDSSAVTPRSNLNSRRTPPNCARCKNHGVPNTLSGHKRYCLYLECKCEKCLQTAERQRSMAKNTAYRRAERQHRKKMEEWRRMVQRARETGDEIPDEPAELLSPIMSPKPRGAYSSEYGSERNTFSPKSDQDSSSISPVMLKNDSGISLNSPYKGKCRYLLRYIVFLDQ